MIQQDETVEVRKAMSGMINHEPGSREALEETYGQVWDTSEVQKDFTVLALAFLAPMVVVCRKSDGVRGSLCFQANPRFYFGFEPE